MNNKMLLITYDLNKPNQDYTNLYSIIKTAKSWWHYLDSTWIIKTNDDPNLWVDKLMRAIDKNDYLFVVDITNKQCQGYLPKKAWEWINEPL